MNWAGQTGNVRHAAVCSSLFDQKIPKSIMFRWVFGREGDKLRGGERTKARGRLAESGAGGFLRLCVTMQRN